MKTRWLAILVASSLLHAGCSRTPMKANDPVSNEELVRVAKAFIEEHRPEWRKSLPLPPKIEDKGKYWEINFELPVSTLGGTPVVQIDKATVKATKAYHTQ